MKPFYPLIFLLIISSSTSCTKRTIKKHYEDGQLKAKGKVKPQFTITNSPDRRASCGLLHLAKFGKWKEYYENGHLKQVVIYRNDKLIEVKRAYTETGERIE